MNFMWVNIMDGELWCLSKLNKTVYPSKKLYNFAMLSVNILQLLEDVRQHQLCSLEISIYMMSCTYISRKAQVWIHTSAARNPTELRVAVQVAVRGADCVLATYVHVGLQGFPLDAFHCVLEYSRPVSAMHGTFPLDETYIGERFVQGSSRLGTLN